MQSREATRLWLPGQGVVDLAPMRVHRAVQAYDERLVFGRINDESHPAYGDWVIFVKMPHGRAPLPVLNFGRELPSPEEAVRRADAANTRRHGMKIMDDIVRDDQRRRAALDKESEELAEIYAEIITNAKGVKNPMIVVPRGI